MSCFEALHNTSDLILVLVSIPARALNIQTQQIIRILVALRKLSSFVVDKKNIIPNKKSKEPSDYMMQCGGCGSKIPQTVLEKIFERNL